MEVASHYRSMRQKYVPHFIRDEIHRNSIETNLSLRLPPLSLRGGRGGVNFAKHISINFYLFLYAPNRSEVRLTVRSPRQCQR